MAKTNRISKLIPLANVDAAWYAMETPTNLMMVSGLMYLDKKPDYERLFQLIDERLLIMERFRQRIIPGNGSTAKPHWEIDPYFDFDNHFEVVHLPKPAGKTELTELVNQRVSTPLSPDRPLWKFELIENFVEGPVLLARLHHSIADGIALMYVLLNLTSDSPSSDGRYLPPPRPRSRHLSPLANRMRQASKVTQRVVELLQHEGLEILANPRHFVDLARLARSTAATTAYMVLRTSDPATPFKGNLSIGKRTSCSQPISLKEVKRIGNVLGGTVNDVLLAVMSGALRQYMLSRHFQFDEDLSFRAAVPVNLRPVEKAYKLGNQFGLIFLSLPVGIEDPYDRFLELKKRIDFLKDTPEAVVSLGILNGIGLSPTEIKELILEIFRAKATCVMTNVPGPRETRFLAGAQIKNIMFWVPQSGRLGLGVSIFSYAGEVRLGIMTDEGLVKDPETITDAFSSEFEKLGEFARLVAAFEAENPESE